MRTTLVLFLTPLFLVLLACSAAQKQVNFACDEAAAIALAPQVKAAIEAGDKAAIEKLAIEAGADGLVCALKAYVSSPTLHKPTLAPPPAAEVKPAAATTGSGSGSSK